MTDTQLVCPACGFATIRNRTTAAGSKQLRKHDPEKDYRCGECGHLTDEPIRRERERTRLSGVGLVGRLEDADPEDVTGD
jgi:predicted RNA-binding Zn-ribbon protein involved in translation (DUF1610 family)